VERTSTTKGIRQTRQENRRTQVMDAILADGSVRIEDLAHRFGISLMTIHRDLDDLEARGILRKSRGIATAQATSLVESSDAYRAGRQLAEKESIARACAEHIQPGQAILLDDSTTVRHLAPHLVDRVPLTVITNALPLIMALREVRDLSLIALGGSYANWCGAFMGRVTVDEVTGLRADTAVMSTAAIVDDMCFHQEHETVAVKRAMLKSAASKILLVDHTKFEKRALHGLVPLAEFDLVIVDGGTPIEHITRLRGQGIEVLVASG